MKFIPIYAAVCGGMEFIMARMKPEYIEKIYAGWLAKIIGIRLGAPIEGWPYQRILDTYGDLRDYPVDYRDFAADDDSNGPLFFLRALEDSGYHLTAQDVGEALLNYAPFEHGFFWWGGYGFATEHTAYLNLRGGMEAPRSGSIEQNGLTIAEQIGGQIFIDTWGLVTPGNPDEAARLARLAASVTHDGNGIYGGVFIAACISHAFTETDIVRIIEKGLSYIPADCEYTRVVRAVMAFHESRPDDWHACFAYIRDNFGYDKYPGNCHIIPNSAVIILAMLYGGGDFSDTITICNMCGWDTDCNVGNVAAIMGVRGGLECLDYDKWRAPINDFLAFSGVMGSMNISDVPAGAAYIAKLAYKLAGEQPPEPWASILEHQCEPCHFEYPGSTHAVRTRIENGGESAEALVQNSRECAYSGERSLKITLKNTDKGARLYTYKKTYYLPEDFHDSRYDPCFSPVCYPGGRVCGHIMVPAGAACRARLYALDMSRNVMLEGESAALEGGQWHELTLKLPRIENGLIREAGYIIEPCEAAAEITCFIDDFYITADADYSIDLSRIAIERWNDRHSEISQFSRLKGLWYLQDGALNLSSHDYGELYTGSHNWRDYTAEFILEPVTGCASFVNVRVQGAIRSYAAGLTANNTIGLYKNQNGYRLLAEAPFVWSAGQKYTLSIAAIGHTLTVSCEGERLIEYTDDDHPYLYGAVGLSVREGSHGRYYGLSVTTSQ